MIRMTPADPPDSASTWTVIGRRQRHVVLASLANLALLFFDQTAVIVALPSIEAEFAARSITAGWTITAFLLALAVCMPWAGRLADRYGRKRVLLTGMAVFGLGSLACAAAPTLPLLIAFRFAQGVGAAVIQPLALAAGTQDAPADRRGRLIGLMSAGGTTFLVLGPLIASTILLVGSWRLLFLVNLPVLAFAMVQIARWLPGIRGPGGRVRWREAVLLLVGLTGVVLGISLLLDDWPLAAGCIVAGLAVLGWLGRMELHRAHPLIPLRQLRDRLLSSCLVALLAIQFAVLASMVALVRFLERGLAATPLAAGLVIATAGIFTPLLSISTGRAADRHGPRRLVVDGLILASVGLAVVALAAPALSAWWLLPGLLLFSLARPAVFTPASVGPLAALPGTDRAFAASLITEARQLGAVLGVAVAGVVEQLSQALGRTDPTQIITLQMWVITGAVAAAAAVAFVLMPTSRPGARPEV